MSQSMQQGGRGGALAPFQVRSFRFQWPADLAASWAFEMEALILGWYVLVESESVMLLVVFGAIQYSGSLLSPFFGVAADRIGYRVMFVLTRAIYGFVALLLLCLSYWDMLNPVLVILISLFAGLIRPSDNMMRYALVGQTMPPSLLTGGLGVSRLTADSARIAGALAGVGVVAQFGMVTAYVIVTALYVLSLLFSLGVNPVATKGQQRASVRQDFLSMFPYVWHRPELLGAMCLAFLVNLLAFPFFLGLLPYVAKNIYATDQAGLGLMGACFALGALLGSLVLGLNRFSFGNARAMILSAGIWFLIDLVFGLVTNMWIGLVLLVAAGFAQSVCLTPLAAVMLRASGQEFRGRVMGMRVLAIWGLPTGLLLSGPLIDHMGFVTTSTLYACAGLALTGAMTIYWRHALWSRHAASNVP